MGGQRPHRQDREAVGRRTLLRPRRHWKSHRKAHRGRRRLRFRQGNHPAGLRRWTPVRRGHEVAPAYGSNRPGSGKSQGRRRHPALRHPHPSLPCGARPPESEAKSRNCSQPDLHHRKFAWIVSGRSTVTVIVRATPVASPDHPTHGDPTAGVAVRVSTVPGRNEVPVRLTATEPFPFVLMFTLYVTGAVDAGGGGVVARAAPAAVARLAAPPRALRNTGSCPSPGDPNRPRPA